MNSERIYDAITDIQENFIEEARKFRFIKPRKLTVRWYALAASLIFVFGAASYILINLYAESPIGPAAGGSGRQEGSTTFMSYAGPVLPLSALNDTTGISTTRDITFDFSGFGTQRTAGSINPLYQSDILITDNYTLTNDSANDKTLKIVYPFVSSFSELYRLKPQVIMDGNELETELMAGPYSGGFMGTGTGDDHLALNLKQISSWEDYITLLSDGEYLKRTLEATKVLDQIVTVYEFSNTRANHDAAVNPTLAASFNLDYSATTMLSYGFHGASFDREQGFMRQSFSVPEEWSPRSGKSFYLIAVGGDIQNLVIQGYINGGCYDGDEMDEVSADMTRYEAELGDLLTLLLEDFLRDLSGYYIGDPPDAVDSIDITMLYSAVVEYLLDYGVLAENVITRYETGWLEELFSEVNIVDRIFYLTAEIEAPADGSIDLKFEMIKPGSYDFYTGAGSQNLGVCGYDMVTTLGSSLAFGSKTAGIVGSPWINIVRQNFGFDITNDILNVTLDLNTPHYYIEVRSIVHD
jgi:hypothetical protein